MMIKAVLFDIDGTLIDSNDAHVKAWELAFSGGGHRVEPQKIHDQIGKGADHLVPALIPGVSEDEAEALGEAHGKLFKSLFLRQMGPFPGARDLLQRVHDAGQKIVLASSASQAEVDHYLDLLDARDLVLATTSADDVARTKPAPDIFAAAMKELDGLSPDDVLAIGDTPYDIEAAKQCGIGCIALRSGKFADEALKAAGAIALYDDVAALFAQYDRSPLAR
ncbi:HAD family hydrolase [Sphingomonas sp. TX0543]|uniref:Membrane protein n=1 Tax=Sphingomonas aquatilis TaxID=93063 RepID=A0AAW3TXK7_9SPHN|nr:HAD family hydrolase [Sphingomonas aquatilis]MBB3877467.1 membrane protein [Sphingomonas aquatilis]GEM72904.1 phosphoglycolate phosphatase [Sphingomonas aquatilis NBRC 16722]